jgi:hypothetical protein
MNCRYQARDFSADLLAADTHACGEPGNCALGDRIPTSGLCGAARLAAVRSMTSGSSD